jgi:DNA mismatch repair ATPase MutS
MFASAILQLFFQDAVTAPDLEITSPAIKEGAAIPMWVPHHAGKGIALIQGYRVAICDQMEPARRQTRQREITAS